MAPIALAGARERTSERAEPYARRVADDVEALVAQATAGDARAWSGLVDRFAGLVWSVARSYGLDATDAADVSQTTWLRLAEHLHNLHDASKVGSWLATTTRREAARVARMGVREVLVDPWAALESSPSLEPELDAEVIARSRDLVVQEALALMPERCRSLVIALATDPAPSYDDISRIYGMPIGSIGPTRSRCLAKLRALIAQVESNSQTAVTLRGDS
jgi:RNA polymerase sigma factor (sigma-70 family)